MRATSALSQPAVAVGTTTVASALLAGLLGLFLVLGTGFAPMHAVHNAVHDARHAAGFPCH